MHNYECMYAGLRFSKMANCRKKKMQFVGTNDDVKAFAQEHVYLCYHTLMIPLFLFLFETFSDQSEEQQQQILCATASRGDQ